MMGRQNNDQGHLFYEFRLDEAVPDDHLVRKIDAVLDLSWVHAALLSEPVDRPTTVKWIQAVMSRSDAIIFESARITWALAAKLTRAMSCWTISLARSTFGLATMPWLSA